MKKYCNICFCVGLILFLCGLQVGHAQNGVIYRDYDRLGWTILDSLKRPEAASLFKGMNTLKRETRMVQEEALVDVVPHFAGKRKLKPGKMMTERRASVLMMFKYLRATTRPEAIEPWATAVVLSEDGVCVTNWHVFWQLIDPTARLDCGIAYFLSQQKPERYIPYLPFLVIAGVRFGFLQD